jgi:signal transduction histidine kinase
MLEFTSVFFGLAIGVLLAALVTALLLRKRLARLQAAERRARAAERMAEVGAMTGGLAHEIKNPLSTIGLNAQLLAEAIEELPIDAEEKGRLSRRIGSLRREIDRLRGILTDFLQYAGGLRLEFVKADLNQIVEELVDFFHPQAEKQGVRLRADLAPGPLLAMLDPPHVKQALLNLMLNAVQAMGESPERRREAEMQRRGDEGKEGRGAARAGTPLTLAPRELILKTERRGAGGAGLSGRDGSVVLHIIDTGPGMDAETVNRIFEPYFTTRSGGTGLGLPTARRLIESHQGRLEVHTEPGRGTDFVVMFPGVGG